MICRNCCNAIDDEVKKCPYCGASTGYKEYKINNEYVSIPSESVRSSEIGGTKTREKKGKVYSTSEMRKRTDDYMHGKTTESIELSSKQAKKLSRTIMWVIVICAISGFLSACLYAFSAVIKFVSNELRRANEPMAKIFNVVYGFLFAIFIMNFIIGIIMKVIMFI